MNNGVALFFSWFLFYGKEPFILLMNFNTMTNLSKNELYYYEYIFLFLINK